MLHDRLVEHVVKAGLQVVGLEGDSGSPDIIPRRNKVGSGNSESLPNNFPLDISDKLAEVINQDGNRTPIKTTESLLTFGTPASSISSWEKDEELTKTGQQNSTEELSSEYFND